VSDPLRCRSFNNFAKVFCEQNYIFCCDIAETVPFILNSR